MPDYVKRDFLFKNRDLVWVDEDTWAEVVEALVRTFKERRRLTDQIRGLDSITSLYTRSTPLRPHGDNRMIQPAAKSDPEEGQRPCDNEEKIRAAVDRRGKLIVSFDELEYFFLFWRYRSYTNGLTIIRIKNHKWNSLADKLRLLSLSPFDPKTKT